MISVKSARFTYKASGAVDWLFHSSRFICNEAIRIVLEEKPKNSFGLVTAAYQRLKPYGPHPLHTLGMRSRILGLKNKSRRSDPYIRRAFVKLDSQACILDHLTLRIPTRPRQFIHLTLEGSDYHGAFLNDPSLKRGLATLTDSTVSIAFRRETEETQPLGFIGVDLNERNITWSDSEGDTEQIDTSEIVDIRAG